MKKIIFLFITVLLTTVSFSSCSDDEDNSGNTTKLLQELTTDDGYSLSLEYDGEQRISKMTEKYDGKTFITTITYSTSSIVCTRNDGETRTFTLDKDGYAVKSELKASTYEDVHTYEYTNGYLSKVTHDDGFIRTYKWQNGNLVEVDFGGDNNIEKYTYDSNINRLPINYNDIYGIEWFPLKGTVNKNYRLVDYDTTYSYEFDEDGYPTVRTDSDNSHHYYKWK